MVARPAKERGRLSAAMHAPLMDDGPSATKTLQHAVERRGQEKYLPRNGSDDWAQAN
jgi:hypothetical protein